MLNRSELIRGDRDPTQCGSHNRFFSDAVVRCICAHDPHRCGARLEEALREFDETAQSEDDFQAPAFAAYVRGERFGKSPKSAYGAMARHLVGGASTLVVLFPAFPARAQGWLEEWVSAGVSPWDAIKGDWCRVGEDMARAMRKASKKDIPHAGECADTAESPEE